MSDISNEVIKYIDRGIRNKKWKVGDRISSENDICRELNVSRSSARIGIRYFIGLNILESKQGKGTYLINDNLDSRLINNSSTLTKSDFKDMKKVLEFRIGIEPQATYLSTKNISVSDINELENTYSKMKVSIGNQKEFVNADMRFHEIIANTSANPFIINSMKILFENNENEFKKFNDKFGYSDGIKYHRLIIDALKERDEESAKNYMKEHLIEAIKRL